MQWVYKSRLLHREEHLVRLQHAGTSFRRTGNDREAVPMSTCSEMTTARDSCHLENLSRV
jgi:hypothetical protein